MITFDKQSSIVLDLDDTLYDELTFMNSAFYEIAKAVSNDSSDRIYADMLKWYSEKQNVFEKLVVTYKIEFSISELLNIYRNHRPKIKLRDGVLDFINFVKSVGSPIHLISDGRSITQRNKLRALGISGIFDLIILSEEIGSEKPSLKNFLAVEKFAKSKDYTYIGDNFNKDFLAPNELGWRTIGVLDNGKNIHHQNLSLDKKYLPKHFISSFFELLEN